MPYSVLGKKDNPHVSAESLSMAQKEFEKLEEKKTGNTTFPIISRNHSIIKKPDWISNEKWKVISTLDHNTLPDEIEGIGELIREEANNRLFSKYGLDLKRKPRNDIELKDLIQIAEVNREVFSEIAEVEDSFYPEKLNPKGDYEVSFSSVGLMPDTIKNKDINTVFNVSETDDNSETRGQYQSQIIKGKINYNIKIPRFKESDNFEDEYSKDSQVLHEYIHHLCDKDRRSFLSKKRDIKEYPQRIVFESFKKKYFADKRMKEGHPEEFIAYSVQEWYYPGGSKMPTSKLEPAFYGLPEFPNEIRRMNFSLGWLVQQASREEQRLKKKLPPTLPKKQR